MAITNLQRFTTTYTSSPTLSCAVSGTVNFVVVMSAHGSADPSRSATFNGESLSEEATYRHGWFGTGDVRVSTWFKALATDVTDESVDLVLTLGASVTGGEVDVIVGYASGGNLSVVDSSQGGGLNGTYADSYATTYEGMGFVAKATGGQSVGDTNGSLTVANSGSYDGNSSWNFLNTGGVTPEANIETHSFSFNTTTSLAVAWMVIEDLPIILTPGATELQVTVPSPSFTWPTDIILNIPSGKLEVVVPVPTFSVPVPRQVALVGQHADMPDRVALSSGLTTPVLSESASIPVWVEASGAFLPADHDHTGDAGDGGVLSHDSLSDVSADDHHDQQHDIEGSDHTASGLTTGHFLRATGTTTFAFGAIEDGDVPSTIARDSEVTAAISSHAGDGDAHGAETALAAHVADTTSAHTAAGVDIADAGGIITATTVEGALQEIQGALDTDEAALAAHLADGTDAHDASAISVLDTAGDFSSDNVEDALAELYSAITGGGAPTDVDYLVGTADGGLSNEIVVGTSPGGELGGTWASPTVDATHSGSTHAATQAAAEATASAALSAHVSASDPHTGYLLADGTRDLAGNLTADTADTRSIGEFTVPFDVFYSNYQEMVKRSDASYPQAKFSRTRASDAIVQDGDILGRLLFTGRDTTTQIDGAAITAKVDGTPGATDMPGQLVFSTTSDAASSLTDRWEIGADGDLMPSTDSAYDIGSDAVRPANVYADSIDSPVVNRTEPVVNVYTSSDTWTKPSGIQHIVVEVQGGGGGGGGAVGTGSGTSASSGGGGGGGGARKVLTATDLASLSTATVTVGAGGAGGGTSGTNGSAGSNSSFAGTGITTVQGNGGSGGDGDGSASSGNSIEFGGDGGAASGGDLNISGTGGAQGFTQSGLALGSNPTGGGCLLGGTASAAGFDADGTAGKAYGGGGAGVRNGVSDSAHSGGAGAAGVVIVTEYY